MVDHHDDMTAAEMKVEAMLDMMTKDKQCFPQILASLPPEIAEFLNSGDFAEACERSFTELDQDQNGVLSNEELLPLLHQMLHDQFEEHHFSVTHDHSKRLMDVFDADGNGVLCLSEWTEFARYVAAYTLLEAQCHQEHGSADGGFGGEPSVEAILQVLREDRRQLYQDLPTLPDWLQKLFESEEFTNSLRRHYHHHDEEGTGVHVERLFPLTVSLSQAHPLKVTHSHCQELMRIYDDCNRNKLSFKEFAEFTEFTFIMSCLLNGPQAHPEDMRKGHMSESVADLGDEPAQAVSQADSALLAAQAQIRGMNNEMAWLAQQLDENANEVDMEMGGTDMSQVGETPSPEEMRGIVQDMRHLQLDLEFSNRKVESLEEEKRELLQVQSRLQAQVRALQQRTEESEQKLQHQELDMRSMVTSDSLSAGPSQLLSAGPSQILEGDPSTLEGVPRGLEKMSRAQAISALQLLHHELDKERKAREKAERRAQKCLERLHRLMGTVERQRDDMSIMEKRCRAMESIAGDRERRLQEGLLQADSLRTLLRNLSEEPAVGFQRPQGGQKKQQRGPAGPLGGPLTRQRSAPNSLPVVHKR